jgi:hypothetical protein
MTVVHVDLMDLIDFPDGFRFSHYYVDEDKMLKPLIEAEGFTNVRFSMGERDSFGPLTRVVTAEKDGRTHHFVYG